MDIQKANYPRNCWWVAGRSSEITRKPLGRWLLEEPIVLYRKENGEAVALEDRCPHRWAPLSLGKLNGDNLVCGYHGFQYGTDGRCVRVPTQANIPENAKVRAYPVVEKNRFVWIWMGDPARRSEVEIPDIAFLHAEGWNQLGDYMPLEANYFLLQENVLDLTHFAFVHADTLEFEGWDSAKDEVFVEDRTVRFRRTTADLPLSPILTIPIGLPDGTRADTTTFGQLLLPGVHVAGIDIESPFRGRNRGQDYTFRICHTTTPETPSTTHYWWTIGQNYGEGDPQKTAEVHKIIVAAFHQDKVVLEGIQGVVTRDRRHSASTEVSVVADRSGVQARLILKKMLARD